MSEPSGKVADRPDDEREPVNVAEDIWDNRKYYEAMESPVRVVAGEPAVRIKREKLRIKEPLVGNIQRITPTIGTPRSDPYPSLFEVEFDVVGSMFRLEYSMVSHEVTVIRDRGSVNQKAEHHIQVLEVGEDV